MTTMTIPSFSSPEEADRWMEQQAKEQRRAGLIEEMKQCKGPMWGPRGTNELVLYSTERLSSGKFGVAVFKEDPERPAFGPCTYFREFALRKDAKARAEKLYWERDKRAK